MNSNPLNQLVKNLSKYDFADLLSIIAGLKLIPENTNRSVSIEFGYSITEICELLGEANEVVR